MLWGYIWRVRLDTFNDFDIRHSIDAVRFGRFDMTDPAPSSM